MSVDVLHDGRVGDADAARSRALQYGDGVFRTVLWSGGAAVDRELHFDKLAADCAALALDAPERGVLDVEMAQVARDRQDAILKIVVARRGGGRGYRPQGRASERWLLAYPLPQPVADHYRTGVRAHLSAVQLSEQPLLAGVKHLNRLDQVLASRDWPADAGEILMCRSDGAVICGSRSNLFVVQGGRLLTPLLDRCGVAGIMRRKILDCAARMNLPARETVLHPADLLAAQEAFVCNAVIGIWPLRGLATHRWPAPGPVTTALMRASAHPIVCEQLGRSGHA